MTVFYSICYDGRRDYFPIDFVEYIPSDAVDISYWVVPGTIDMED